MIQSNSSAVDRDTYSSITLLRDRSGLILSNSRDGAATYMHSVFQCLIVKNFSLYPV